LKQKFPVPKLGKEAGQYKRREKKDKKKLKGDRRIEYSFSLSCEGRRAEMDEIFIPLHHAVSSSS